MAVRFFEKVLLTIVQVAFFLSRFLHTEPAVEQQIIEAILEIGPLSSHGVNSYGMQPLSSRVSTFVMINNTSKVRNPVSTSSGFGSYKYGLYLGLRKQPRATGRMGRSALTLLTW